jgi:peptide/nickel transport system permease protein
MTTLAQTEPPPRATARLPRHQWLSTVVTAARTRRGAIGFALAGLVVLVAAVGPFLAPHASDEFVTRSFTPPSRQFLLGGDNLGRDVLSRTLDGGWLLLLMAFAATLFGLITGTVAGVSAAYRRGRIDTLIMRSADVVLAFPQLVFALLLVSIIGPKLWLIVIAVGIAHAPQVARVMHSATLDISERDYVRYVQLQGVPPSRVMTREIIPNLVSPLMVEAGLRLTYSIVIMAGLSFVGFGQQPPAPNWGTMINENRIGLQSNVWAVAVPALLIAVLTIGASTFTDAVARVAIGVDRRPSKVHAEPSTTIPLGA